MNLLTLALFLSAALGQGRPQGHLYYFYVHPGWEHRVSITCFGPNLPCAYDPQLPIPKGLQ